MCNNNENNQRETETGRTALTPRNIVCVVQCCCCCCLVSMQCESVCMPLGLGLWHNRPQQQKQKQWRRKTNFMQRETKFMFRPTGNWFIWVKKKFNSFGPGPVPVPVPEWCDLTAAYRSHGMPSQITVPGICKESEIFCLFSETKHKKKQPHTHAHTHAYMHRKYGSSSDKDVINFRMKWAPPTGLTGLDAAAGAAACGC